MFSRKVVIPLLLLSFFVALILFNTLRENDASETFTDYPLPFLAGSKIESHRLFDIGIVDVNSDSLLDIYTTNHNFRQTLMIADGNGDYHDALDELGLNQVPGLPGAELTYAEPQLDQAGIYVYWLGKGGNEALGHHVVIRGHRVDAATIWSGSLKVLAPVEIAEQDSVDIDIQTNKTEPTETEVQFFGRGQGYLALKLNTWGLPLNFTFKQPSNLRRVYFGSQAVPPVSKQISISRIGSQPSSLPDPNSFSVTLQDRHGLAWSDYNNDGQMDAFATRGAIGGRLTKMPLIVREAIRDQFFVSRTETDGRYDEVARTKGFRKHNCSGRDVKWLDHDGDGLLDLYVNCQDRGRIRGTFPKQLYRQTTEGLFIETAAKAGLALPDHQLIDSVWIDADRDGDGDLLTTEAEGFVLYRNAHGRFTPEYQGRGKFARGDKHELKYVSNDYWDFNGKLSVSDYDGDGDLDVFSCSKKANTLLQNNNGRFAPIDPSTIGLPDRSVGCHWVDYDNDGLVDFHDVPQGLFRQKKGGQFHSASLLVLPTRKYMGAIANWPDLDNDGSRDVLIAAIDNPAFYGWWERLSKNFLDISNWNFMAYRNNSGENHWLQLKLRGLAGNPEAIGAQVIVATGERDQLQEVGISDGAIYSQGHYRLYFGLGENRYADQVTIRWPDGHQQLLGRIAADRLVIVERDPEG